MTPGIKYIEALWWLMPHSDYPERRSFVAACYLDDSGNQKGGSLTVVAGPLIPQMLFTPFHLTWEQMLCRHKVEPPIHMREFARPHGRLAYLSDEQRQALFQDLVHVITQNKLYSVSASVWERDFSEFFPSDRFKGLWGPAPHAFAWCIILNIDMCVQAEQAAPIAYVISESEESSQMLEMHRLWKSLGPRDGSENLVGAIAFDSHKNIHALQAADMIAWSVRRRKLVQPFDQGFGPLERLTRHVEGSDRNFPHFHLDVSREHTKKLAEIVNKQFPNLPKIGRIPLLLDEENSQRIAAFLKGERMRNAR